MVKQMDESEYKEFIKDNTDNDNDNSLEDYRKEKELARQKEEEEQEKIIKEIRNRKKVNNDKYSTTKEGEFYRIIAEKDFGDIKKGTKGGLIEKESNLSQNGTCWIEESAKVYGNAVIIGDNHVAIHGEAEIYDDAHIHGSAQIYGKAHIFGTTEVREKASVFGNAKLKDCKVVGDAEVDSENNPHDIDTYNGGQKIYRGRK